MTETIMARAARSCFHLGARVEAASAVATLLAAARSLRMDGYADADALTRAVAHAAGEPLLDGAWEERLMWELGLASSVTSVVLAAQSEARTVGDELAGELFPALNLFASWLGNEGRSAFETEPEAVYAEVRARCHGFQGELEEAQPRGPAFHAIRLGALSERARRTARVLAAWSALPGADTPLDHDVSPWAAALRACGAPDFSAPGPAPGGPGVVAFLLNDPAFPHSISFSAEGASAALAALPFADGARDAAADALRALHDEAGNSCVERVREVSAHAEAAGTHLEAAFAASS